MIAATFLLVEDKQ